MTAVELCDALLVRKIWAQDTAPYSVRFVTHCDIDSEGIARALQVLREVVAKSHGKGA